MAISADPPNIILMPTNRPIAQAAVLGRPARIIARARSRLGYLRWLAQAAAEEFQGFGIGGGHSITVTVAAKRRSPSRSR